MAEVDRLLVLLGSATHFGLEELEQQPFERLHELLDACIATELLQRK